VQAYPNRQDHSPEITLSAMGAPAFIEVGEKDLETDLIQPEQKVFPGLTEQLIREGNGHQLTVRALSGRFNACWITADPFMVSSTPGKMVVRMVALSHRCRALLVCCL
jgi:hypothetical protein